MTDAIYVEGGASSELRPLFSQLKTEFSEYEIWVRQENFGRTVLAAVVSRQRGVAVIVPVSRPNYTRKRELDAMELGRIRSHLQIGSEDLSLP